MPIVTHVHGAVGVGDESDGYAEAWYLPAAGKIPAGYATEGTWYNFFASKAATAHGVTWGSGFAIFQYPNANRASTVWYHDHVLGMTRLNVYAGPAGFYIIRGGPDGDDAVLDSRSGMPAVLPGPAPKENDEFRPNKTYYEIRWRSRIVPLTPMALVVPEHAGILRRDRRRLHSCWRLLADLESRVLRQHDDGQR